MTIVETVYMEGHPIDVVFWRSFCSGFIVKPVTTKLVRKELGNLGWK